MLSKILSREDYRHRGLGKAIPYPHILCGTREVSPLKMRDIAYVSTLTGFIGAVVVDGLTFLQRAAGLPTQTPWGVGARVFLRPELARSPGGIVFGLLVSLAMSIAGAFFLALFLRGFGYDHAVLKGVLVLNALGFITLGLFGPLVGIAPLLRGDLVTNFVAVVNLSVLGAVQGGLVRRLLGGTVRAG